jgi:hypothetical protein
MARLVGTGGSVTVNGSTVANILDWQYSPQPVFVEHTGWSDSSRTVYNTDTRYSGSFRVERNDANSAQTTIGTSATSVTLVLGNGEDSFTISAYAWRVPSYTQGRPVTMSYQFRDRG